MTQKALRQEDGLQFIARKNIVAVEHFNYRQDLPAMKELTGSIEHEGLLQAITVRPQVDAEGKETGDFDITDGYRRFLASAETTRYGKPDAKIPCLIRTEASPRMASIVANESYVSPHPADLSVRLAELVSEEDLKPKDLAVRIGKSGSHVRNLIRAGKDLSPESLDAWRKKNFSTDFAFKLAGLTHEEQAAKIEEWEEMRREDNFEGSEADSDSDAGESTGGGDSDASEGSGKPSAKEITKKLENYQAKEELNETQVGIVRALKWVLGLTNRV